MTYLRLSRYALAACILVSGTALILGTLWQAAWEPLYLIGIISGVLVGPLAANALVAHVVTRVREKKAVKHG